MANLDGYECVGIDRFSSLVEQADATVIPFGCSPNVRNSRFNLTSCDTRYGLQVQYGFKMPSGLPCTGLVCLKTNITSVIPPPAPPEGPM